MRDYRRSVRRLRVISSVQAVVIALMFGAILYLLQFVRAGSTVTITPVLTSGAHATALPNATTTPTLDTKPSAMNANIQLKYQTI